MLTNTLVLFLRDLLPMFIMFAYLTGLYRPVFERSVNMALLISSGILLSILVLYFYEHISELFEGTGIEWLKICLIVFSFICFFSAQVKPFAGLNHYLLSLGALCLLIVHLNSFLLYFAIYFMSSGLVFELLIGCAIGLGICVSFYVLFSFFIEELWHSKFKVFVLLLWCLFVATQLSMVSNYLHQIDVLNFGSNTLFNFSIWVQEQSEYGFILKALTGFDARPSFLYVLLMAISFGLMFTISLYYYKAFVANNNEWSITNGS